MAARRIIAFIKGPDDKTKIININDIPTWSSFKLAVIDLFPSLVGTHISFSYKLKDQNITIDCEKDFENALPILAEGTFILVVSTTNNRLLCR